MIVRGLERMALLSLVLFMLLACYASAPLPDDASEVLKSTNPWKGVEKRKPVVAAPSVESVPPQSNQRMMWAKGSQGEAAVAAPTLTSRMARMPRLAVMDIDDRSGSVRDRVLGDLTEYLRARLTATGRFLVIDRSRQGKALKVIMKREKSESYRECYSKQCQIPLGQALSADSIMRAKLSKIGGTYALSVEIVDLAKEATVSGAVAECSAKPKKGLDGRLLQVVRDIVKDLESR